MGPSQVPPILLVQLKPGCQISPPLESRVEEGHRVGVRQMGVQILAYYLSHLG